MVGSSEPDEKDEGPYNPAVYYLNYKKTLLSRGQATATINTHNSNSTCYEVLTRTDEKRNSTRHISLVPKLSLVVMIQLLDMSRAPALFQVGDSRLHDSGPMTLPRLVIIAVVCLVVSHSEPSTPVPLPCEL